MVEQYPHLAFQVHEKSLANKTILVTGAGAGIGKQAALVYAQSGAEVILLGRTVSKLEAVYDEIIALKASSDSVKQPSIVPLDLHGAKASDYDGLTGIIEDQYKKLDGILLNASVLGNLCPFEQIKESEYDEVMQTNVKSHFLLVQSMLGLLKRTKLASVIFTTSSVGRQGRAFWGGYAISKFATEGMMQVLADEHKNSLVRFNCINPGATRTDMRAKAYPGEDPKALKTPAQIMAAYVYLMSDISRGITGQSLDCQPM
ncbi:short chain dehydrogenase [Glaciecola punicea ACAM 611]|jgi:NAD(P)-dependent dehydrogenase (short-subunit alcohol dehydrogenase family)|uniref:Short chain dehydrogenase n=1 Tax=Glaciecola punicea ACAM 611 TaxID=1121923 RepID=H5TA65_9ALTE|nr:YciK family oxidoreductase [Glaciecola punicea]OFA33471.1 YciK family oxidoreductase [Glaciecola punicea]GAB55192.1 short chain dehydrogenase [Glaciecola punicea ACAM 611]